MQLEDYFEFERFDTKFGPVERIRIKGHRISIEDVLEFFKEGFSPETIVREIYPTLNLEKVYATILYYLANKERVEDYIRHGDEIGDKYYQEHLQQEEPEVVKRLKALIKEREKKASQVPAPQGETPEPAML